MSAEVIDGKAIAAEVRERVADVVARRRRRRTAARRASRRCSSATTRPPTSTSAASARPARRRGSARSTTSSPADVAQASCSSSSASSTPTPTSTGSSCSCRCPDGLDPDAVLADLAGQGRRRADPGQRRAARPGPDRRRRGARARVGRPPSAWSPARRRRDRDAARRGVELEGAEAVIVGRSNLVGRPLASLLLNAERDRDRLPLADPRSRRGLPPRRHPGRRGRRPRAGRGRRVKPGATVIDVGMNRTEDGLVGDVDFDARRRGRGAITPVPGGVGPMTIAMLLANTVRAARERRFRLMPGIGSSAPAKGPPQPQTGGMSQVDTSRLNQGEKIAAPSRRACSSS